MWEIGAGEMAQSYKLDILSLITRTHVKVGEMTLHIWHPPNNNNKS